VNDIINNIYLPNITKNTMMEGQQGYEKHLWPPTTKREKNKQSE